MSDPKTSATTIVIVGGGFAGITLARKLEGRLPPGCQLVLISEESYTTFHPMLAEVVGAGVFPEHVIVPIREMVQRTRFIMGRVDRIDPAAKTVHCQTLLGERVVGYTHLIVAVGQRANLAIIPGMEDHALPLKLVGDAMHLRNRVLQRLACIELASEEGEKAAQGHLVVVGGGFSGVEVAGALIDFLHSAKRYYPRVSAHDCTVTLVHDGPRLLPELPAVLGEAAARSLAGRGVEILLNAKAARVTDRALVLGDGRELATRTVVCTVGTRPNPLVAGLVASLGVPLVRGRLEACSDMSVPGVPGLWVLGDCAAVPNAFDHQTCPPTAQCAVSQARQLADNLLATLAGRPTQPCVYRSRGAMSTTGHQKGVAQIFGWRLTGLAAWLAWRAYYLAQIPSFGRKVRIWVEWTWSMFFPADITHLRFTRTTEVDN